MLSSHDLDFLELTALLRYPTIRALMAAWGLNYDEACRFLARVEAGTPLVDRFAQPAGRGRGSNPPVVTPCCGTRRAFAVGKGMLEP